MKIKTYAIVENEGGLVALVNAKTMPQAIDVFFDKRYLAAPATAAQIVAGTKAGLELEGGDGTKEG